MENNTRERGLTSFSSAKLIWLAVATLFISELLVMLLVHLVEPDSTIAIIVDPVLRTLFLLPIFLFFVHRPLHELLAEREDHERQMLEAYSQLEEKVRERTEELARKNEVLYREIEDRRKAENELREKNAFLHTIIESLDHPFYVIDARTYEIKLANRAAGFDRQRPAARCYELTHHRNRPCDGQDGDPCLVAEVVASGKPRVAVHSHFRADGTKHEVEVHTQPIFDEDGHVTSVIEFILERQGGSSIRMKDASLLHD